MAEVSNDVRRVAYQLHPSILDHLGLAVALRSYCSEFSKREGIRVLLSTDGAPEKMPEPVALCLYRLTQESLRNVAKHARAKSVSVKLRESHTGVHLTIRDNGVGFDTAAPLKGGIGLLSMKERVRLVDGEFALQSTAREGNTNRSMGSVAQRRLGSMKKTRLLIADDHTLVLEGFKKILESEVDLVGTAENGRDLVRMNEQLKPDVILGGYFDASAKRHRRDPAVVENHPEYKGDFRHHARRRRLRRRSVPIGARRDICSSGRPRPSWWPRSRK